MNKNTLRKLVRFAIAPVICAIAFYYTASFCHQKTDRFYVAKIHSELPFHPEWETAPLNTEKQMELRKLLDQKFYYLGSGGQCFAFASDDGKYVVKFFKHKTRKPFNFLLKAPLPGKLKKACRKKLDRMDFKLNRDFTSYKIAYEDLNQETGLLYIHLNKGTSLKQSITIVDKIGVAHQIALDDVEFVVQKRAELAYTYVDDLMAKGDVEAAKKALHSMLEVIVARCKKGVFDEDARIHRNFGFIDAQPIFIDVGRFRHDPSRKQPAIYKQDLADITERFRGWLQESYPPLAPILEEELNAFQKD
jgi:hypothetical protein